MQIVDNPLMEAYKTLSRYGTIETDRKYVWRYKRETRHSRTLVISYQDKRYLVMMMDGEVNRLEKI